MKIIAAILFLVVSSFSAQAATKADADAAIAAAIKAEDAAGKLGNRWLPAEAALKAAMAAESSGAWDTASAEATKARLLAERATEQSKEQETAWRDAVIR